MLAQIRPALIITAREVRDQFRDWRIIFPVLGLTLFFPFLMNFTAQQILGFVSQYGATIIGERLVPFLLMIVGFFPISVSLVIALETFVGEKERSSIEPLLNTPLKDWQLYLGKLLSATVPPLVASFLGMGVYLLGLSLNQVQLPSLDLMGLIVVLTIVQALVMVSGAVVVSCQTTSVRAANLLASFIIIPIALVIQGESVVMFWGDYQTLWFVVLGMVVLTALLIRVGIAHFQREELLGREIDVLNFRWGWRVFKRIFTGGVKNIGEWYSCEIPRTLRSHSRSILICVGIAAAGAVIGAYQVQRFYIPIDGANNQILQERIKDLTNIWPVFSIAPVATIWWQNLRAMLIGFLLGIFSMGIFGMLPLILSMGVMGYIVGLLQINGFSAILLIVGLLLPHCIFEIPAAILATAEVLHSGAVLASPAPGKTVGEVFIESLANWTKIMIGIVIPLLLLAAMVEAWVTPRIAAILLHF